MQQEAEGGWKTGFTDDLSGFIAAQSSVFFATASADGQPNIQIRRGLPGFLPAIDSPVTGFVDLMVMASISLAAIWRKSQSLVVPNRLYTTPPHPDLGHSESGRR